MNGMTSVNPIEHVWDAIGRRVAGRQPHPQTLQELEKALLEEWDRIPQLVINSLIDSMPQSLENCRARAFKADRTTWKRIRYGFITIKSTTLIGLNGPRKNTTLPAIRFVEPRRTHIPV
ncbi:transposable element Tcb2 transposase [Trichonephila clavipes]|nr:transposable element Tcb2 transposase [Trichonephila clavipes]